MDVILDDLSDDRRKLLKENGFDADRFENLVNAFNRGELSRENNRFDADRVSPPEDNDIQLYPGARGQQHQSQLRKIGLEAIEDGKVGLLILNGGMATRFGGVVKGTVELEEGRSFLHCKFEDAAQFGGDVPVLMMNSFSTHEPTLRHLDENDYFGLSPDDVITFNQGINLRITPGGRLFRVDGKVSPYAPGHGDLAEHIKGDALQEFLDRGGRYLLMSNVDNLLGTIDPAIVGHHIVSGNEVGTEMTVEVAKRHPSDKGGWIAEVDDSLQIVEGFQFPQSKDFQKYPVFNTNTLLFDAESLQRDFNLNWYAVDKEVDNRTAIQFERLVGELSAFLETSYLLVPSDGEESRYHPIKRPGDLTEHRDELVSILSSRLSL